MELQRKRGVFDVLASLLEVLEDDPCNKTLLGSRANLASRSSKRYIDMLLRFNLATKDYLNCFKLTDEGRVFLHEYKKLRTFIEE